MTRITKPGHPERFALAVLLIATVSGSASAASFGELSSGMNGMSPYGSAPMGQVSPYGGYPGQAGPYATMPNQACPPNCIAIAPGAQGNAEGQLTMPPDYRAQPFIPDYQANPRAYLPVGPYGDQPHAQVQLWSYGQMNSTTDPFNPWGLSTPYMFVPWSTPLSGWTNAQTWNWWRERSGALPRNW